MVSLRVAWATWGLYFKKQTTVNYTDGIPKWTRSNFMADCLSPFCHTGAQSDTARSLALICSQFSFYCRRWSFWGRLCCLWMHMPLSAWKHLLSLGETPRHRTDYIDGAKKPPSYFPKRLHNLAIPEQWMMFLPITEMGAMAFSGIQGSFQCSQLSECEQSVSS